MFFISKSLIFFIIKTNANVTISVLFLLEISREGRESLKCFLAPPWPSISQACLHCELLARVAMVGWQQLESTFIPRSHITTLPLWRHWLTQAFTNYSMSLAHAIFAATSAKKNLLSWKPATFYLAKPLE